MMKRLSHSLCLLLDSKGTIHLESHLYNCLNICRNIVRTAYPFMSKHTAIKQRSEIILLVRNCATGLTLAS